MRILFRLCLTTIVVLMAELCYAQSRATLVGTVTAADTEAPIACIGSVIGAHVGPGAVAIGYFEN